VVRTKQGGNLLYDRQVAQPYSVNKLVLLIKDHRSSSSPFYEDNTRRLKFQNASDTPCEYCSWFGGLGDTAAHESGNCTTATLNGRLNPLTEKPQKERGPQSTCIFLPRSHSNAAIQGSLSAESSESHLMRMVLYRGVPSVVADASTTTCPTAMLREYLSYKLRNIK
jgi:hypothetical protein